MLHILFGKTVLLGLPFSYKKKNGYAIKWLILSTLLTLPKRGSTRQRREALVGRMGGGEWNDFLKLLKTANVPGSLGLGLWGALPNSICWIYFSFLPLPCSSLLFLDSYGYGGLDFPP